MTTAPHADEVHRMVDRLAPPQVEALYVLLGGMLSGSKPAPRADSHRDEPAPTPAPRRRLSFIGIMDGEPDLAARSARILRDELGDPDHGHR